MKRYGDSLVMTQTGTTPLALEEGNYFFKTKGRNSLESEIMVKTEHNDLLLLRRKLGSLRILHSL